MGRLGASLIAISLALALALGVAACGGGSSDLLSGTTANEINSNLGRVRELVAEGDCAGAEEAVSEVSTQVESLEGVNGELKEALREGAKRLGEVVSGCEEAPEEPTEPAEETEETEERAPRHEKKEQPEKTKPEPETAPPVEPPEPPGQEKQEEPETPPAEPESPSGGVGPGTPAGEG
jgi:outer membrane biosynthesis protein TonB